MLQTNGGLILGFCFQQNLHKLKAKVCAYNQIPYVCTDLTVGRYDVTSACIKPTLCKSGVPILCLQEIYSSVLSATETIHRYFMYVCIYECALYQASEERLSSCDPSGLVPVKTFKESITSSHKETFPPQNSPIPPEEIPFQSSPPCLEVYSPPNSPLPPEYFSPPPSPSMTLAANKADQDMPCEDPEFVSSCR